MYVIRFTGEIPGATTSANVCELENIRWLINRQAQFQCLRKISVLWRLLDFDKIAYKSFEYRSFRKRRMETLGWFVAYFQEKKRKKKKKNGALPRG